MKREGTSGPPWSDWDEARDPALDAELDAHLRLDALLVAAHAETPPPDVARLCAAIRQRAACGATRAPGWPAWRIWCAAAALLLALAGGALLVRGGLRAARAAGAYRLTAGRLLDAPATRGADVDNGRTIRTAPDSRARLTLRDGSVMELAPASQAVVAIPLRQGAREVRLLAGGARFQVVAADRRFRVITPVGTVTVKGTEFAVELDSMQPTGGTEMRGGLIAAMAVAVLTGSVEVRVGTQVVTLGAGQTRVFAGEGGGESTTMRSESFGGVVVGADGASVTIERRGDGGVTTRTIAMGAGTRIRVEGPGEEEVAGEGGKLRKQRQVLDGTAADLAPGKHIRVKLSNDMATEIFVKLPKSSGGGESERSSASSGSARSESRAGGERRESGGVDAPAGGRTERE